MLVNPGPPRHLEWPSPYPERQTISNNAVSHKTQAVGKLRSIRGRVLAARVLIALINLKIFVAERLQMFRLPVRIGQRLAFIKGGIKCGPTPPPDRSLRRNARVMQHPNRIAISH